MSATSLIAEWIADRDRVLDAIEKGYQVDRPASLVGAGITGTEADQRTLRDEAVVLRLLQQAIAAEASAEVAAEPEPIMVGMPRSAARSLVMMATLNRAPDATHGQQADAILDALGWPT